MSSQINVCVIGAGGSGLLSIKSCLDADFDVTCYEQSDDIGGLWKYRDDDVDGIASVARSTIINSSKELSAFSEFPPSPKYANYMHNSQMFKYFNDYADHFGLRKHIVFNRKVLKCEKNIDYMETGRWKITSQDLKTHEIETKVFNGLMVCTGHHVKPLIPKFEGQENFKGRIIHSHSYKKPTPFDDQKVVVVGIGNSGGDIAVELSLVCKKVYHSFRRGAWTIWRVGSNGLPMDAEFLRRFSMWFEGIFPSNAKSWALEWQANLKFDHTLYRIKPAHRLIGQHVFVNDSYPNRVLSGTLIVKRGIKKFTHNGVIFEDETTETECDAVILATGYDISFPFLDRSVIWSENGGISLYKHTFSPRLEQPNTLAIIGLIQPIGPLLPISEMQARWFVELMRGTCKLPRNEEMLRDIKQKQEDLKKRYYESPRHQIQVDYPLFMDELAGQFGVKPDLTALLLKDPMLWYRLVFGPFLPYQYRLQGPFAWNGARKAIMTYTDRVTAPFKTRSLDEDPKKFSLLSVFEVILAIAFAVILTISFSFAK